QGQPQGQGGRAGPQLAAVQRDGVARDEQRHPETLPPRLRLLPASLERLRPLVRGEPRARPADAQLGVLAVAEELDRERRPERARAQRQRADRALDPLAIGQEGQLATTFDVDVAVGAQPADRAQRRFDQLAELAGLLVEDEALHLEARDLQHLLQQTVEPLRLPLEDLDRPWIGGLALLDPAGERIRESLDAGERGLQLVRGEAQEAVLARLALGGGEHRARAAQQGLERLQRDRSLGREA